jgi:hypothetical protein
MQVPDTVYHLMRHTALKGCNLSSNVITKITPKFAVKFSLITGLGKLYQSGREGALSFTKDFSVSEMGGTCSRYGGRESCVQGFGGQT